MQNRIHSLRVQKKQTWLDTRPAGLVLTRSAATAPISSSSDFQGGGRSNRRDHRLQQRPEPLVRATGARGLSETHKHFNVA
jgi:hypothetical protein